MYTYRATAWKVLDGHTVAMSFDYGFRRRYHETVRLLDVTAPAINETGGVLCRNKLTELLGNVPHIVTTHNPAEGGRWRVDVPGVNDAMRAFIESKQWERTG